MVCEVLEVCDRVYGKDVLKHPVFAQIVASSPFQRLHHINQFGVPDEFNSKESFSRAEHSLGAATLVKRVGGSVEEQLAALTHDGSHLAFSHIADFVFGDPTINGSMEDLQDSRHPDFILHGEWGRIISRYSIDPERIANYHKYFTLLEKNSPDLCADRVDYSLREVRPDLAQDVVSDIKQFNHQMVMTDYQIAQFYGRAFLDLQIKHWGSPDSVRRQFYFAEVLKVALDEGDISREDFEGTDNFVLDKVKVSDSRKVQKGLEILRNPYIPEPESGILVFKKFRYIDPLLVGTRGRTHRLSELSKEFKEYIQYGKYLNEDGALVDPHILE